MNIGIAGRTGDVRPDYHLTALVSDGAVELRFNDVNNPEFWLVAAFPQSELIDFVSTRTAYLTHRTDPDTGLPDADSGDAVLDPRPLDCLSVDASRPDAIRS